MRDENLKMRHLRAASGLTQEDFCERADMDPGTLALYGKPPRPSWRSRC